MIVVCGEALIDVVRPASGAQRSTPGGGPYTTTRALARLGVPAAFLGRLSTDPDGRRLADLVRADGANLELTSFGAEPTTRAIAEIDSDGHATYRFVVEGTAAPNLTPAMLPARLGSEVTAIHVGALGLVLQPIASTLVGLLEREGGERLVMLDPNIRPSLLGDAERYRKRLDWVIGQSTIVKASEDDLAWLFPTLDLDAAATRMLDAGVRLVVVTLAARGAVGFMRGLRVEARAPTVTVVDTIGAGDAFGAALLAWLHEHDALHRDLTLAPIDLKSALAFACVAAAITCTRAGADPPTRAEVGDTLIRPPG